TAVVGVDFTHAAGDLGDGRVPANGVEAAVGASAQGRRQPILVMGVEGDACGLVAEVTLRLGVGLVAAHLGDAAVVDRDFDAAVHIAEVAGGLVPFGLRHRTLL